MHFRHAVRCFTCTRSRHAQRRSCVATPELWEEVVIGLGSNEGDRVAHLTAAAAALRKAGVAVCRASSLYESAPAYVTDQPAFLNAALSCRTSLQPEDLLTVLKRIEKDLGRKVGGQRYGPRPIDLDIVAYGNRVVSLPHLQVPHPLAKERRFVLAPVSDLATDNVDCTGPIFQMAAWWRDQGGEALVGGKDLSRVLPLTGGRVLEFGVTTHLMGVLNVTPDSFSDGGDASDAVTAVDTALAMAAAGARVIDVGGQSTRPGATQVSASEELLRVVPVIQRLKEQLPPEVVVSVDTFYGEVASAAVAAGAQMVNDVSGGRWDPTLLPAVAASGAAYVAMHSRGTPVTMQLAEHTRYPQGLLPDICEELRDVCRRAEAAGIDAWRIVIDPGLGFAKSKDANVQLLRDLRSIRPGLPHAPILVGPSRKGFLGVLVGGKPPKERDWATAAAVSASIAGGADFVRIHNVQAMRDVAAVADAIYR